MITRNKVIQALENKRALFQEFGDAQQQNQQNVAKQLERFLRFDYAALCQRIDAMDEEWTGAHPTPEWDAADGLCMAPGLQWTNHQDARAWALEVLRDRPVIAVDGSQITPTKDYAPPVGAVQIGWFINEHRQGGHYIKDLDFDILAPQDLADGEDVDDERGVPSWRVHQERFVRECTKLCELMTQAANRPQREKPLCFFDGSFIISFAGQLRGRGRAEPYLRAVRDLLQCSEETRVPLVAFVDGSYSHDIVTLMSMVISGDDGTSGRQFHSSDAGMLSKHLPPELWGSRCPAFICSRRDSNTIGNPSPATFYKDVAFTYMRLSEKRSPARLEMPRWIYDEEQIEDVLNLVRAECVVGAGYPYAIETADALAVISMQDRQRFYGWFDQFVDSVDELSEFVASRKATSKRTRR